MAISVVPIVQVAGRSPIAEQLRRRLSDSRYHRLRLSVAFARWSGLHLIDAELQSFLSRRGHSLEAFVGVDLGGTTLEALTYLAELPRSKVFVVRSGMSHVMFHPKVYALSGPEAWCAIVGSSNLSTGGLIANIESSLLVEGTNESSDIGDAFFAPFRSAPFRREHVQRVDDELLAQLGPTLDSYSARPPDRGKSSEHSDIPPLDPTFSPPYPVFRPPAPPQGSRESPMRRGRPPVSTEATVPTGPSDLYMELWDETGGGTQVQMAKRVFTDYFGGAFNAITYISLQTPAGVLGPIRLQQFGNSTYRIGLSFVGQSPQGAGRRGVLRFRRLGADSYRVDLRLRHEVGYTAWLGRCDEHANPQHKRYGFR